MIKVIKDKITKCSGCSSYLKYDQSDIETHECSYGVGTYYGETYIGKFITCPVCGKRVEV